MAAHLTALPFMVRLPADLKSFIAVRSKLTGRSMASEMKSMLEVFMDNDPCSEIEIAKDRGRYVLRSHFTPEVFRSFASKNLAVAAAKTALSEAGLAATSIIDMTGEEVDHAG
ncbi:hypothetical protein [Sinorhizobium fredii]|uniref:hypothetical protein n=2 Tax=Rhizobium fredii TaxID=380 RepID=UPI003399687E